MPKIVDKEKKRTEIARQAMGLFAEKGFDKTSIREVTEAIGMGKGTFYDYFSDKTDLLLEVSRQIFSAWHKRTQDKIASVIEPMEKLSVLLYDTATLIEDYRTFIVLYMEIWLLSIEGPEHAAFNREFALFLKECRGMVRDVIEEAKTQKTVKQDINSDDLAVTVLALIDGLWIHSMVLQNDLNLKGVINSFLKNLREGIQ